MFLGEIVKRGFFRVPWIPSANTINSASDSNGCLYGKIQGCGSGWLKRP